MPFTKYTNLDFDQIKTSIKDYLRANSDFTDFDFEGSNFSTLIDVLAYNTYINAFNANMVVNESFLDSATVRQNVVSLARSIGYVPRSRTCSRALISFSVQIPSDSNTGTLTLKAGLVCVGKLRDSSYVFSIPENITTTVDQNNFTATFENVEIYQGTYLTQTFNVDGSLDQRFILDNSFIDTSTIVTRIKAPNSDGDGIKYSLVDNVINITGDSETYLIQEIQDEKYELLFGDNIFGRKVIDKSIIDVSYIVTDGKEGNGARQFAFAGDFIGSEKQQIIPIDSINIQTIIPSINGGDIEPVDSIKYFAPRLYSSQYRAVTTRDYETIVKDIYRNAEAVLVTGGEDLDPPQFGNVFISIKPINGDYVSDFDKIQILSKLKQYSLSGIKQEIIDLKILYVEVDSAIYYNPSNTSSVQNLKTKVIDTLNLYATSSNLNTFGGRFKYSKLMQTIDNSDYSITSNITKVIMRRNLRALVGDFVQYELCFGNEFHINPEGFNIRSTGFKVFGESETVYLTDVPNKNPDGTLDDSGMGTISIVKQSSTSNLNQVVVKSAGTVDYTKGEIMLFTIRIESTDKENDVIEVQAFPESNDVIALKDLYLVFDVSKSDINMVNDTISSGEKTSGVGFKVTSSYSNEELRRLK
jgi:hypothetical protein